MQHFYDPQLNNSDSQFTLDAEESRHAVKVLRKKEGDMLQVTNGKGYLFNVRIIDPNPKGCKIKIVSTHRDHQKMYWIHLAVAPTKMIDRYEWFLEKVTEIGVNEITPVICERSERKVIKSERLEKVVQAAMKQSLRTFMPKLNPPVLYTDFLKRDNQGLLFIAHCENDEKAELKRRVAPDQDITMLIGPEGDFSPGEINQAYDAGYLAVSLGDARLRTETAAIVACTTINLINGT